MFISQGVTDNDALMRCDNDLEHVSKMIDEIKYSTYQISSDEALSLFYDARLEQLIECSSYLRNKFKPSILTYSRKVFVNLVNLCRDTCTLLHLQKRTWKQNNVDARSRQSFGYSRGCKAIEMY